MSARAIFWLTDAGGDRGGEGRKSIEKKKSSKAKLEQMFVK